MPVPCLAQGRLTTICYIFCSSIGVLQQLCLQHSLKFKLPVIPSKLSSDSWDFHPGLQQYGFAWWAEALLLSEQQSASILFF